MLYVVHILRSVGIPILCYVDRRDCSQNWLNPLKCQTTNAIQKKKQVSFSAFYEVRLHTYEFSVGSFPFLEGACIVCREFSTFTSSSQFPFNAATSQQRLSLYGRKNVKTIYKRKKKEGTNRELSTAGVVQRYFRV